VRHPAELDDVASVSCAPCSASRLVVSEQFVVNALGFLSQHLVVLLD
jgi:hypothetical protein